MTHPIGNPEDQLRVLSKKKIRALRKKELSQGNDDGTTIIRGRE